MNNNSRPYFVPLGRSVWLMVTYSEVLPLLFTSFSVSRTMMPTCFQVLILVILKYVFVLFRLLSLPSHVHGSLSTKIIVMRHFFLLFVRLVFPPTTLSPTEVTFLVNISKRDVFQPGKGVEVNSYSLGTK